MNKDVNIT